MTDTGMKEIIESIRAYIELEREAGMEYFEKRLAAMPPIKSGEPLDFARDKREAGGGENPADLAVLKQRVEGCAKCKLSETRTNVVFGSGNPRAELMFVGEAPGADEDEQGVPFVGRAGALLTKIIEAMGLTRDEVYIANILKCRPPGNRPPLPEEILACGGNLEAQIGMIRPKVIVTLGKFASQTLLKSETPISALRGKFQEYNGIKVMPTFHPAYLLRNPAEKRTVWADVRKVLAELKKERSS